MMQKLGKILYRIFGVGVLLTLLAGGLSCVGYVAALVIGGETATALCALIFKGYLPYVIRITSVLTGIGLVGMYLNRKKALSFGKDQ